MEASTRPYRHDLDGMKHLREEGRLLGRYYPFRRSHAPHLERPPFFIPSPTRQTAISAVPYENSGTDATGELKRRLIL